jgi:hypothetical protein
MYQVPAFAVYEYHCDVHDTVTRPRLSKAVHADAAKYLEWYHCFAWANTNGCVYDPDQPDPEYCLDFNCENLDARMYYYMLEKGALFEASVHCYRLHCTCIPACILSRTKSPLPCRVG